MINGIKKPLAVLGLTAVLATAAAVTPVTAMTSLATFDGVGHPSVVALMIASQDGVTASMFCSGTAITATVIVTASHCASFAEQFRGRLFVTNDPSLDGDAHGVVQVSTIVSKSAVTAVRTNPAYKRGYREDVSALVIDGGLQGIAAGEYPALPAPRYLDQLQAAKQLRTTTLTVMGYGTEEMVNGSGPATFLDSNERRFAEMYASALDPQALHEAQNINKESGGACYGDSGGPTFVQVAGVTTIVGVTSTGDIPCWATNTASRIDRPQSLAFLATVLNPA